MREGKIKWFNIDPEEYPIETPIHKPSVAEENNNNTLTLLQSKPQEWKFMASEVEPVSEVIKRQSSEGVTNTPN